jgi:hypothetical protein
MGLLDDAIREHLELRRRRGVDPSEVAREEQDALGALDGDALAADEGAAREEPLTAESGIADEAPSAIPQDASYAGQETAELDMRTILGVEPHDYASPPDLDGEPRARRMVPSPSHAMSSRAEADAEAPAPRTAGLEAMDWDSPEVHAPRFVDRAARSLGLSR